MSKADKDDVADKRVQWLEQRVANSLKLKGPELKKFMDSEDNRNQFIEFLDVADTRHCFVTQLPTGSYVCKNDPPEDVRRKGMYFFKQAPREAKVSLNDETSFRQHVSFGDLTPDSLAALHTITKQFFAPLVGKTEENRKDVPDVAVSSLVESTASFTSQVLVTLGLSQGKTLLPVPPVPLPARLDDTATAVNKDMLFQF